RAAITHDANHRNGFTKLFVENIPVAKRGAGSFIYRTASPWPSPKERGKELLPAVFSCFYLHLFLPLLWKERGLRL
ncbi:MAG: hypothetical protein LBU44_09010, partial [Mediterranea sp.]|nr:hypothetical protein [Mediterranea sp.]